MEAFKLAILNQLFRKEPDGMSWFGINRNLAYDEFLPVIHRLGEALKDMEADGLVETADKMTYKITTKGKLLVKPSL